MIVKSFQIPSVQYLHNSNIFQPTRRPIPNGAFFLCVAVLFLLDEFPRLGKIEPVITGLTTLRSKKIHVCLIAQSLAQLDVIYGKDQRKVIVGNCSYRAILQATDVDTQEYFSKSYGTHDKEKESKNINYDIIGIGKGTSKGTTTEEKHKIKLEEFAHLTDIVLFTPKGSIRVDKAPYYEGKTSIVRGENNQIK